MMKPFRLGGMLWASCLLVALTVLFPPETAERAFAKEPPKIPLGGPNFSPQGTLRTRVFTIDEKSPATNHIFISERRYKVAHGAPILDYRGRSIPLKALPTPCRARITYRLFGDHRDPMVEKIQLR